MTPSAPAPCIAAAVATHHREKELARLLDSLQRSDLPLAGGIFVADNAASPETRAVCAATAPAATWLPRATRTFPITRPPNGPSSGSVKHTSNPSS